MKKTDFENLLQDVLELKAARRGALPTGSIRKYRWSDPLAAFGKNVDVHDRDTIRASSTANRKTQCAR